MSARWSTPGMDRRCGSIVALIGPPWNVIGRSIWMYDGTESACSIVILIGELAGLGHARSR
jgi:hypothetical protein